MPPFAKILLWNCFLQVVAACPRALQLEGGQAITTTSTTPTIPTTPTTPTTLGNGITLTCPQGYLVDGMVSYDRSEYTGTGRYGKWKYRDFESLKG